MYATAHSIAYIVMELRLLARVDFGFSIDYYCVGSYPRYVLLYYPSVG